MPVVSGRKPNPPFALKSSKSPRHGKEAGACPSSTLWASSTWALCSSSQLQRLKGFSLPSWKLNRQFGQELWQLRHVTSVAMDI
jgi:hypothetical protein